MRMAPGRTIAQAAAAYRSGALSPVEVTTACLERIAELDGRIQAFATVTAELALAQARAAEAQVRADPDGRRPLLGIPVGVKDIVDVAGVATGGGSAALSGRVAAASATVWRRLEAAGAVLVGKTRTHELAYGVATPPARNPWDPARIPGGSSGGSAAAIAAGMCLGAVGTDTAGSIRIPAGLCGVVGFKPTAGRCPTDGILPLAPTLDHAGPLAATVDDARLLFAAMAGIPVAPSEAGTPVLPPRPDPATLRAGVARTDALLSADVGAVFERAVGALDDAGAAIRAVRTPSLREGLRHTDTIILVEAAVSHADLVERAAQRLAPRTLAKLRAGARVDASAYHRAVRAVAGARDAFAAAFADVDLLIAPGVAVTAPAYGSHTVAVGGEELSLGRALCHNTALCNLAGVPAVAVPAGMAGGLPVGIQLIGPAGGDEGLLAAAAVLAERFGTEPPVDRTTGGA